MMKNRNKPIQAALFFCVVPMFLATSSCTTQDTNTVNLHSWTKDVNSLTKGKADSRFWSSVRSRSNLADAHKRLGGFYQKQGKHRKAIAEFIKAIKTKTGDARVYNSLAMSYDALKQYEFAEMAYKDAIALAPEEPYLYNNYGCSNLLRGDIDAAVALFEKAASLDSESSRIKNNLSLAILRGNKKEMLNGGNQEAAQLPGLYVTKRKPADTTELKAEVDSSDVVASVPPDKAVDTVEAEAVSGQIIENIEEPVKEVALIKPAEIQPEFEKTVVAEEVQANEESAETNPVTPAQLVTDDRKKTTSTAAISSDNETSWYNEFVGSILATLGFENDEKTADVAPSVENDQLAVVPANSELTHEKSIVDMAVTKNEQQEKLTVIQKQTDEKVVNTTAADDISIKAVELIEPVGTIEDFDENHVELPTVESVEKKLEEKEAVETVTISTIEVPEATTKAAVGETFEVVTTEDDTINKEVDAAFHAANTDPDSVKEEVAVMAEVDKSPELVNEIVVDTKSAGTIQVKTLMVADSMKDDISYKYYNSPETETQIHTQFRSSSMEKKAVEETNNRKDAQGNQKVAIEVSNGNGVEGMATRSAAYFREQGENIRRITNAKHFGFKDSIVFYREGYLQEAYKIALMVPGYQKMKQVESLGRPEISVRLLLGKDMVPLHFPESMVGISRQKISTYKETVTLLSR